MDIYDDFGDDTPAPVLRRSSKTQRARDDDDDDDFGVQVNLPFKPMMIYTH
jgi:hypothetical protein